MELTSRATEPAAVVAANPGPSRIGTDYVHAWLVDLDDWPAAWLVLDARERDRSASYVRPLDGARFAASRAALRLIMSGYLGCEPEGLPLVACGLGRSSRMRVAGHGPRFSLSRSGGVALIAVSPGPVGADVELLLPRAGLADLASARFAAPEAACLAAGCGGSPTRSFYRHWVAKEAYLKATGRGLAALRDTELSCVPGPMIRFRGTPEPAWKVELTETPAGYLAAVVASRPVTAWAAVPGRLQDAVG